VGVRIQQGVQMNINFNDGAVSVTDLRPGDCMVLTVRHHLSDEQRKAITNGVLKQLPSGTRVLVVDGGIGVSILRQKDVTEGAVVFTTEQVNAIPD
jgi:hypothetical protein